MTHSVADNLTNARRKEIKALLRKAKDKQGYYYLSQNVKKELEPVWVDKKHNKLFKRDSQRVAFSICVAFSG